MSLDPKELVIHIINIAVTFVLLRLILWKHVYRFMKAREERVKGELDEAKALYAEAESVKADYEQRLDVVQAQGRDIIRDSQIKASEEAGEIVSEARRQVEDMMSEARAKIDNERGQAIISARYEMAQMASDLAARILKREVSVEDNKAVVDEFFSEAR
ncbi:MAG: ATP synthase F0 subunit B [Oscillospiraceae bacterium]|jgi:F-type H+-transporting ATPase subunit b|nr:ATP synthase F0 subunit B [Oscillospiraceae bacterium]